MKPVGYARGISEANEGQRDIWKRGDRAGNRVFPWPEWRGIAIAGLLILLGGCSVVPKYHPPVVETPPQYKEQAAAPEPGAGQWKEAQPGDQSSRGKWWTIYADPQLNALEEQVTQSNQTLKISEAQFREARALIHSAYANKYPTLTTAPAIKASRSSANRSSGGNASSSSASGDFLLPFDVSYEPDLWGRVRIAVEGYAANAQAVAADLENVRLSLQAELAMDYFQLRSLDHQKQLLDSTVAAYQKSLELTTNRYNQGVASKVEVEQAQTQLEATRAQAIDLGAQRAQFEHAIAVLTGQAPSGFSLASQVNAVTPPKTPAGLPSELLERRPDIAAAERQVVVANIQIGVAKAAYYPSLDIAAMAGFEASHIADWFAWPSRLWSVGTTLTQTLFDGGRRRAQNEQVLAAYDATVASYRQSVLNAFQEVEDNLAALRVLAEESQVQESAVQSASRSLDLSINRYKSGVASYLEVLTAQNALLTGQRTAVTILWRQMVSSVQLVKALGGGWDSSQLPSTAELTKPIPKPTATPAPAHK
jgi:NodT family efflux transporter outer membrane factor (OMF) lipoprotein